MNSTYKVFGISSVVTAVLIFACQLAYAATIAGQVQFAYGNVQLTAASGQTHSLKKGDVINEGDTVITAAGASAQIRMKDEGFIAVRPNTNLRFDKFVFNGKEDGKERSFFSLIKGGFRAITGLIGKENKQNYSIRTVTATIGVRGTDHETFFVPEGDASIPAGAYSKVNVGETTVTTNRGTINVLPNQMGYAGNINEAPKIVPINTNLFTVAATPTKTIKQSKEDKANQGATTGQGDKGGQTGGTQSASSIGSTGENAAATNSSNTSSSATPNTNDPTTVRAADSLDSGSFSAANVTTAVPSSTSITPDQLKQNVSQVLVPITMTNTATGTTLNATSVTQTSGGVSTTLTGSTVPSVPSVPSAAYANKDVAVLSGNFGIGSLVSPTNLTYVTGTAGGSSSSGALSSYTEQNLGGGSNYSNTYTITGGTANSFDAPSFGLTGIQYGSWTGYTSQTYNYSYTLGGNNNGSQNNWMYGPQGYIDATYLSAGVVSGAMAGTFTYNLSGNNAPRYQNSGIAGTLNSASITANFSLMQVSASLGLNIGTDFWGANITTQPITSVVGGVFSGFASAGSTTNTMTVTHGVGSATACLTCSGNLSGMFTGQNFSGAMLSYSLSDSTAGTSVYGDAALNNSTPVANSPTPAPTGLTIIECGSGCLSTYSTTGVVTSTGNVLTQYSSGATSSGNSVTVNCPTCTATLATGGIYFGNWTSGTYTSTSTSTAINSTTPAYWITGPEAGPLYLPQALTGTASYVFDAGQVTNSAGVPGTVNTSTALTVNFTNQTVGINLNATSSGHTWIASTASTPLTGNQGIGGGAFYASGLSVTVDGAASTGGFGTVNGQLTGSGLTGAIINFNLSGSNGTYFDTLNGVAAFTGTAQNINSPYRTVLVSTYNSTSLTPALGFYFNNPSRISQDASGNLTQFDTNNIGTGSTAASCTGTACSGTTSSNNLTISQVGATLADHGTDPVSGISWGRWAGGTLNTTDRATGIVSSAALTGSLHWIAESASTTPVTLPITGTYAYTLAGGTRPTDNLGNVGTLNSASVTANFTAQTVGLGVNATVNGATLNATAPSAPIIQSTVFYASSQEPSASSSYLTVTCTGTCTTPGGIVIGKFTGAGATGVAMSYGLQNGSSIINGVAAFHR